MTADDGALIGRSLLADVFVPEVGAFADHAVHEFDAGLVVNDLHFDSSACEQFLFAQEGLVLANNDTRNAVEQDGSGTHRTWRKRRVDGAFPVDRR